MSFGLLLIVTAIYAFISIDSALNHNAQNAIVFAGYAAANCGLLIGMKP